VDRPPVLGVVGPTATGKSELGLEVALRLGGEVVNADSMQLYRGMDIGTAKLPVTSRRGVPHHLLDIWEVRTPADVATYQSLARTTLAALADCGRAAVLVGGSGLYVRAALDDLHFPGTVADVRSALEDELRARGPLAMHAQLATVDPDAAAHILPGNARRIVRALEVVRITGRPFVASLPEPTYAVPAVQVAIDLPRDQIDRRIEERVDQMWRDGLVAEVRSLVDAGLRGGRTASRALGYAQVLRFLDGSCSEEEARAETVSGTRRFARRQESWFRRDPRVHWLPPSTDVDEVADSVVSLLTTATGA
jgi:tRNA dimethylallyltransferase